MRAGKLRHRITIEAPTASQDEYGEPIPTWAPLFTVWAAREDLAGREYFAAAQIQSEVTTKFRIRHRDGITAKMRVNDGGRLYDIAAVQDPEGRGRELILLCVRREDGQS
jgi:SPP1 family predicted phage head-tail adaptor